MRTKKEIQEYKNEWARKNYIPSKYPRGHHPNSHINGFKKGHPRYDGCGAPKGSHNSPKTEFKKNDKRITGRNNPKWKGEKSSYTAKHQWIRRWGGNPNKCEHCETEVKRMYHWANISGKYKHKLTDWIRLCVPCHKKYDQQKR